MSSNIKWLAPVVTIALSISLAACTKQSETISKDSTSKDSTPVKDSKSSTDTATSTNTTVAAPGDKDKKASDIINIDTLPDEMVICRVSGSPITVSDFKLMLKMQQMQLNSVLAADPATRSKLLAEAQKRGVQLTDDEKVKVLNAAKDEQAKTGTDFQTYLKQKHVTEDQYNKEVLEIALAYKLSNLMIQQSLLPDLINRELLVHAAKNNGLEKKAMDQYFLVKHSRSFDQLKSLTGMSSDLLRDEVIKSELAKLQIQKIQKDIHASDADLRNFYNNNKEMFKHNERIRLSSIFISAPNIDQGRIESIKTQVAKANPKLKGKELDLAAERVIAQQEQRGLVLLGRAKAGEAFAKLANDNSDDPAVRSGNTGGDMGWQEKRELVPDFGKIVWNLKSGAIVPSLIRTNLGFQVIKATGHEKAGYLSLEEVKAPIEMRITQEKLQQAVSQWLANESKKEKVEFTPKFQALAAQSQAPTDKAATATPSTSTTKTQ